MTRHLRAHEYEKCTLENYARIDDTDISCDFSHQVSQYLWQGDHPVPISKADNQSHESDLKWHEKLKS